MTDKDFATLKEVFARTGGKAWEPRDPKHPAVERMVAAGFVKRVDGRCGFEAFKDSHLAFTEAGLRALENESA